MLGNVSYGDAEAKEMVQSMLGDELKKAKGQLEGNDEKTS